MPASIDIGTNTVLFLVAEIKDGALNVIHEEQRMPRLGKGVDSSGNLHPDSMEMVLDNLKEYKQLLDSQFSQVSEVFVTATSAVRDAGNKQDFIKKVHAETGFEIQLLSGIEEAAFTYSGALSVLPSISKAVVIDIGGGSTEVAMGEQGTFSDSHSFDMGSVRFTERYLKHDPPNKSDLQKCRTAVDELLDERKLNFREGPEKPTLIGVAGTVTSLAYMDLGFNTYKSDTLNGYILSIEKINSWIQSLSSLKANEIENRYPDIMKGRADVITGGLLILEGFMNYYSLTELTVSTGGIRHGAIIKKAASN